ncbi:MAG: Glu/Leu/Phe/Val family dehydrogenase, partial [Notoacmeibacter sp.]
GNVGYHAAKFLSEEDGCAIIAIAEYNGGISNSGGIDIEAAKKWMGDNGSLKGFPGATFVENAETLLETKCDILIPAALEAVINKSNCERIDCKLLIEAANGPVTAHADEALRKRGVVIIPDLYANAGGVTVSYFEWVKNLSHIRFGRMQRREEEGRHRLLIDELESTIGKPLGAEFKQKYMNGADELALVRSGLDDTMRGAYAQMRKVWHERRKSDNEIDLRISAYMIAIQRVADSYRALGL